MNKHKPQGHKVHKKYSRYLSKSGASDIWARELLNGMYDIDDRSFPTPVASDTFLNHYELYEEDE